MIHVLSLSKTEYDFLIRANKGALHIVVDGVPAKLTFIPDEIETTDGCDFDFGLDEWCCDEPTAEEDPAPRYFSADTMLELASDNNWMAVAGPGQRLMVVKAAIEGKPLSEIASMIAMVSPGYNASDIYDTLTCFSVRNGFDY